MTPEGSEAIEMLQDTQEPDLRAIKTAARTEFGLTPGVQGFGIGDHTLRIYIHNPDVRDQLPTSYQGVPVDFVVTGDVTAQSS